MEPLAVAALVAALVCLASVLAVEWALSVAIVEILAGVVAGNALGIHGAPWLDFLAQFGGVLLTFLAGAEVDPGLLRSKLKPSLALGGASFVLPFLAAAWWMASRSSSVRRKANTQSSLAASCVAAALSGAGGSATAACLRRGIPSRAALAMVCSRPVALASRSALRAAIAFPWTLFVIFFDMVQDPFCRVVPRGWWVYRAVRSGRAGPPASWAASRAFRMLQMARS